VVQTIQQETLLGVPVLMMEIFEGNGDGEL
jgi:hypothetical protein